MRILAKYLIFVSVVFLSIHAEADTSSNCDAPEVIDIGEGFKYHNTLLCSGIEHMNAHRFRDAITAFETALSLRFLDVPNFELLPRLAEAYFRAGDIENAKRCLSAAELSLSILIGALRCVEVDVEEFGFSHIVQDEFGTRVTGVVVAEVLNRMCGAAYEYIYDHRSFDRNTE